MAYPFLSEPDRPVEPLTHFPQHNMAGTGLILHPDPNRLLLAIGVMMMVVMMVVMVTNDNYNLRRQRYRCSEAEHER
jgi:hypothetical protein